MKVLREPVTVTGDESVSTPPAIRREGTDKIDPPGGKLIVADRPPAVHFTAGRKRFDNTSKKILTWKTVVTLDAMYYAGVTPMAGFWLMIGETQTPFASWAAFAGSCLSLIAIEPVISYTFVRLLKKYENSSIVTNCFAATAPTLPA